MATKERMKKLERADSYVCTSVPIDEAEHYITGFKAEVGESHNAHHILLFGCDEPGSSEIIWDCGEMSPLAGEGLDQAPTCASSPNILYAWAHNAPELTLPEGVAFRVGGNTKIQYLVMQVHYMKQQDQEDTSGVTLTHTKEPQPKTAATMLLVTGGVVPPKSTESFETACVIDESVELHPFAYRTHTHKHGVDVSGWIVQENEKGDDMWTLIGRRDPQLPQMFVPVSNQSIVINQGDLLAARCILKNDENQEITIGPTGSDEMCNFYIMYWADSDKVLQDNTCFSPGAPYYYWSSEANLNHIPL
ncbi:hypothetical protein WR25_13174 [Diploscapter pachys]|uniref:peptidylglycine monooxygenase n=1 Tax=Diploscapter pachys TaxID=2018661 RepID=A0A2A2LLF5_9BILA|nr:hypothetical protein WR25_13174 [Diploscapter pachys]